MHRFELRVRYSDTDQMGWVYYANYLRWFEVGRAEMLRSLGRTYRGVEEDGTLLPVLEAHCRYFSGARYDDLVAIETGIEEVRKASVTFGYRIVRAEDGEVVATFRQPFDLLAETVMSAARDMAVDTAKTAKSEIWLGD